MKAVPNPPPAIRIWRGVCRDVGSAAARDWWGIPRPRLAAAEDVRKSILFIGSPLVCGIRADERSQRLESGIARLCGAQWLRVSVCFAFPIERTQDHGLERYSCDRQGLCHCVAALPQHSGEGQHKGSPRLQLPGACGGASLGISVRLGGAIARPEASNPRVLSTPPVSQHPPVDYTTLFCAAGQVLRLSCGIMGAEAK